MLKKTTGRVRGWIGYTYAETKRHTIKHGWYYPKYDRTHTINIVGDVELFKKGTGFLGRQTDDDKAFVRKYKKATGKVALK